MIKTNQLVLPSLMSANIVIDRHEECTNTK
jgi:hypothetical protein